ncbi:hypothetical protein C8K30_101783 [Promicromonospora sp. AC04]|uniref:hypothetical protein n=1 Tax=Promicromonospora sp. AC04 TaxID=2135723 RepID=UPI000D416600|nr:hypothetical protein [Promicromonospora sp. AC04]PUB32258.1 hypothetical protein C8K30_101783 [Promicromonospora sp. AC04]
MSTAAVVPARNGLAVAGFVLALVGILFAFIPIVNVVAIPLGALGLVFGVIGIVKARSRGVGMGLAVTAVVLSVLSVVVFVVANATLFAAVTAVDSAVTDVASEPAFLEYDLDADPGELYPNDVFGDVDQNGKVSAEETYAKKGSESFVKDEDLDGNGVVTYYETGKYWYDFTNS